MKKRILIKCGYYGFSNHFDHNTINIHNLNFLNFGIMKVLDVTHISARGSSFRTTLPKKIIKKLGLSEDDIIAFYEDGNRVYIDKLESPR